MHHSYYKCSVCHEIIGEMGDPDINGVLYPTFMTPTIEFPLPSSGVECYCFEHDPYSHKLKEVGDEIKFLEDSKKIEGLTFEQIDLFEQNASHIKARLEEVLKFYKEYLGWNLILENGYLRFAESCLDSNKRGEFFHIWRFKKYHGKIKPGYEVHHRDFNKLNNSIKNLQEVSSKEHKILHQNRFR